MNTDEIGILLQSVDKKVDGIAADNKDQWIVITENKVGVAVLKDRSDGAEKAAKKSGILGGLGAGGGIILLIKIWDTVYNFLSATGGK
jgi:hypothetical protein